MEILDVYMTISMKEKNTENLFDPLVKSESVELKSTMSKDDYERLKKDLENLFKSHHDKRFTVASLEAKPVEAKPVEAKPVEAKPVEAKPVEAKPVEVKPVTNVSFSIEAKESNSSLSVDEFLGITKEEEKVSQVDYAQLKIKLKELLIEMIAGGKESIASKVIMKYGATSLSNIKESELETVLLELKEANDA